MHGFVGSTSCCFEIYRDDDRFSGRFPERLPGILVHVCENLASRNFEGILPFPCRFVGLKSATFLPEPALDGSRVEASNERIFVEQQEQHNDRDSQIISKSITRNSKQTEDHSSKEMMLEIRVGHF